MGKNWIVSLIIGAVLGFIVGYIVWIVYGQIQIFTGSYHPYAALSGPPLYYLIAWAVFGAIGLLFKKK